MATSTKRKTSLTLDVATLDAAREMGVNVSAVADAALRQAILEARQRKWLEENVDAFAAQASWHEQNRHPLADIMMSPGRTSWTP